MMNCSIEVAVRGPEGLIARRTFQATEKYARGFATELEAGDHDGRFVVVTEATETHESEATGQVAEQVGVVEGAEVPPTRTRIKKQKPAAE